MRKSKENAFSLINRSINERFRLLIRLTPDKEKCIVVVTKVCKSRIVSFSCSRGLPLYSLYSVCLYLVINDIVISLSREMSDLWIIKSRRSLDYGLGQERILSRCWPAFIDFERFVYVDLWYSRLPHPLNDRDKSLGDFWVASLNACLDPSG